MLLCLLKQLGEKVHQVALYSQILERDLWLSLCAGTKYLLALHILLHNFLPVLMFFSLSALLLELTAIVLKYFPYALLSVSFT